MDSELDLGYLDDLTIGGAVDVVAKDVQKVVEVGGRLGLTLNVSKCELIAHDKLIIQDALLQSFSRVSIGNATLLGAPLFTGAALDRAWADRCSDLSRAVDRLALIDSQAALILLRASFSAPKVMHLLRCAPSKDHPSLDSFDGLLRLAIQRITNSDLSDNQWLQASLPVRDGGLGIRRVSSLALPAFLASAASTLCLQDAILSKSQGSNNTYLQTYLSVWSSLYGTVSEDLPSKQSFWDRPGIQSDRATVEAGLCSPLQHASFLAASSKHSGDWLFAMPIASCGLKLDNEAIRIAVGLRLGLSLCVPHPCHCGSMVDAHGVHSFVCRHAPGRIARHQAFNDVVARAFASAGIPAAKEPVGLLRDDGKRPDGLTMIPWQTGRPLTWDVTFICTLAESYRDTAARSGGAVAELAATRKLAKYASLGSQYLFQPIAVESLGPINDSALDFLNDLGRRIFLRSGDEREASFLFQRISVLVQRFNSVLLHDSFSVVSQPD